MKPIVFQQMILFIKRSVSVILAPFFRLKNCMWANIKKFGHQQRQYHDLKRHYHNYSQTDPVNQFFTGLRQMKAINFSPPVHNFILNGFKFIINHPRFKYALITVLIGIIAFFSTLTLINKQMQDYYYQEYLYKTLISYDVNENQEDLISLEDLILDEK